MISPFSCHKITPILKYFDNQSYLQTPYFNANIAVSKVIDKGGYGHVGSYYLCIYSCAYCVLYSFHCFLNQIDQARKADKGT